MSFRTEYYEVYLSQHQNPWNRICHIAGQLATVSVLCLALWVGLWWVIPLTPLVFLIFAIPGHFFVEKNHPAFFDEFNLCNPIFASLLMTFDVLTGRLPLWGDSNEARRL